MFSVDGESRKGLPPAACPPLPPSPLAAPLSAPHGSHPPWQTAWRGEKTAASGYCAMPQSPQTPKTLPHPPLKAIHMNPISGSAYL